MKYCRHCGTGMDDNAAVCLNCGISENTPVKKETAYCKNCGAEMNSQAAICIKCGVSQTNKKSYAAPASVGNSSGKLTRSANGKILAGVFSGLGKQWNINPWILRAATIILNFFGIGVLIDIAYVIAIFALPMDE